MMSSAKLDDFIPVNIELASRIGLVDAAVAGAIWLKWNIHQKVCNAGTRELGRMAGLNFSTVSNSIKRLVDTHKLVEDLTPDRKGAPHDLIPSVDLINTLCKASVDDINTEEDGVDLINGGVDDINTSVDLINKEEVKNKSNKTNTTTTPAREEKPAPKKQQPEQPGPLTASVLNICGQDFIFVSKSQNLKGALLATVEYLDRIKASPADVADFDNWRRVHHWTGKGRATFQQVAQFWQEYLDWIKAGRPAPAQNGGNGTNGHRNGKSTIDGSKTTQSARKTSLGATDRARAIAQRSR